MSISDAHPRMRIQCFLSILLFFAFTHPLFADKWISLFNGEDIKDWTAKFTNQPVGKNPGRVFRVEDGKLKVSYDDTAEFNGFGHLFYKTPFSHYRIRAELRFTGEQLRGGPGWAYRNNGLMLHCQPPETMALGQNFPTSIEVQV